MTDFMDKLSFFLKGLKNLMGVGIYLLFIGIIFEILTMVISPLLSFPISLSLGMQITLTFLCVTFCLTGMIWFNKTLNLVKIHLAGSENKLMSQGPFNYVRHPLYTALLISLPPLFVIWFENLLFMVPWVLVYIIASFMVEVEERNLVRIFGNEYLKYKQFVPRLFPYKGNGGRRFREYNQSIMMKNQNTV